MGRPDHVQLIFARRVNRRTPSRYRTRVITDGVTPSLHVDYKHSRIKQYHKEGRALRTETVINDTYDFDVGRRLSNLDDLKRIGFAANRRLRVQSLFAALLRFDLLPRGFRNRELREAVAPLCGLSLDDYSAGRMTYDLRRLRLRGLIERIPCTVRYRLTPRGCASLWRTTARKPAFSVPSCRSPSTGNRPHAYVKPSRPTTGRSTTCGTDTCSPRSRPERGTNRRRR